MSWPPRADDVFKWLYERIIALGGIPVEAVGWSYSGEKGVGTHVIKASAGILHGFLVETDGSNDVTVQLYDHASTATNPITPSIIMPASDRYGGAMDIDATCSNGIVLVLSGTGGVAEVYYN